MTTINRAVRPHVGPGHGRPWAWVLRRRCISRHAVPVLLDAAHRVVQQRRQLPGHSELAAAGRFHLGAFKRVLGLSTSRRRKPRAAPARPSTSGCTCATR